MRISMLNAQMETGGAGSVGRGGLVRGARAG